MHPPSGGCSTTQTLRPRFGSTNSTTSLTTTVSPLTSETQAIFLLANAVAWFVVAMGWG